MAYITGNPEIDMVEKCLSDNYHLLSKGILPKSYINKPLEMIPTLMYNDKYINWRDKYAKRFGFPLFAENWVKPLAQWIGNRPCLEIMAGTGYLSYFLKRYGVNIIATDDYSWKSHFENINNVEMLDCIKAIENYGENCKFIICSWPYMDDGAYKALLKMREVNSKCRFIYIGEGWGGCTADDRFFEIAEECNIKSFREAVSKYRSWYGVCDRIVLYK